MIPFDAKRFIGHKFTDATVPSDLRHWPFKLVVSFSFFPSARVFMASLFLVVLQVHAPKGDDKPYVEVAYKDDTKDFQAEEISSMALTKVVLQLVLQTHIIHSIVSDEGNSRECHWQEGLQSCDYR